MGKFLINLGEDDLKVDHNTLDGKAKALKEDYDRLHRLATNANPTEFVEPKVRGLWKLAQEADFNNDELESLRQELHHYEKRMEKLHHLKAEVTLQDNHRYEDKINRKLGKGPMSSLHKCIQIVNKQMTFVSKM